MTNNNIVLNGITLKPTEITLEEVPISTIDRMADGTLKKAQKAIKKKWTLSWSKLTENSITTIRNIYRTTTAITYIDEFGVSTSVLTTSFNIKHFAGDMTFQFEKFYDVELLIEEV